MFSLPIGIVLDDIQTTGSTAIDLLARLSIALYDLMDGAGSTTVASSDLDLSSAF